MDSTDGLFRVDRDQTIVYWSDSAERLLGVSRDDVLGKKCHDVLGAGQTGREKICRPDCHVIRNARRRRTTRDFDLRHSSGGKKAWLNVGTILLKGDAGAAADVMHVVRDVTEWRSLTGLEESGNVAEGREGGLPDERASSAGTHLSRRERQVIRLLASGASVESMADALGLSSFTVRNHISRAMVRLGAHTRLDAVVRAARLGLV